MHFLVGRDKAHVKVQSLESGCQMLAFFLKRKSPETQAKNGEYKFQGIDIFGRFCIFWGYYSEINH